MSTLEIAILSGFVILAGYMMWVHYHLINRDFAHDIFHAINGATKPTIEGLEKFLIDISDEIKSNTEAIQKELREQSAEITAHRKMIQEQTMDMTHLKQSREELLRENSELRKELRAKEDVLERMRKRDTKS